jgi:protein O-GlcNAc transferase
MPHAPAAASSDVSKLLSQAQRLATDRRWTEAAALYRELLAQSPEHVDALEGLGLAALHGGRAAEGLDWLTLAKRGAPGNARIIGHLGLAQKLSGLSSQAIETYREAVALDPQPDVLLNLARAEREAGRLPEAIAAFERVLELERNSPDAWSMLSNALREAGRFEEALRAASEAVRRNPWHGQAHLNQGAALHCLGRLSDAVASYWVATTKASSRSAAARNLEALLRDGRSQTSPIAPDIALVRRLWQTPDDAAAMLELARLEQGRGHSSTAMLCLERAAELGTRSIIYQELSVLAWGLGQRAAARDRMLRAFECPDVDAPAYRRLGAWLVAQPTFRTLGPRWQAVFERCPDDYAALSNLGVALRRQGLPSEAERLQRRALMLDPDRVDAHANLGRALNDQGCFREAAAAYRRALELDPTLWMFASNLLLFRHADPSASAEAIFAEHVAFGQRYAEPLALERAFSQSRDPERRLKLGYVSRDFRLHPVAHFIEPVLAEHDPNSVDVHCYSDVERPDAITARLASLVPHFIPCAGWTDARLADQIASDQIDILVDLSGHTGNNRLLAFARKPSPVQVAWLGYFDTTGLSSIDYRIADEHAVPAAAERFFVERVVRLPRSQNCFLPGEAPEPSAPPCLSRGWVTFGCFNNPVKLTREVIAVFGRILRELGHSRLKLKYSTLDDPGLRARYLGWLGEEGIEEARVDISGASPMPRYLECLADLDIALDPFPYTGETTALHTLWMGVPVVTLEGQTLVQRLGSRVLRVAGLDEWVASSADDYVRIALALARAPQRLKEVRAGLRERLRQSPLLDHRGVTRELEAAYRQMWRTYCARAEHEVTNEQ